MQRFLILLSFICSLSKATNFAISRPQILKPLSFDPLKRHPSAEKVLTQLIPSCSLHFFGNPYDTPIFPRFLDICIDSALNFQNGRKIYCQVFHASTRYPAFFSSLISGGFSELHLIKSIAETNLQKRYSDRCHVLLPYISHFDKGIIIKFTKFTFGRTKFDFVFLVTPENPLSSKFMNDNSPIQYQFTGKSIVFLLNEESFHLFLFCQPCAHTLFPLQENVKSKVSPFTSSSTWNLSTSSPFFANPVHAISFGLAIDLNEKLGETESLLISRIQALWWELHGNIGFYSFVNSEHKNNSIPSHISRICNVQRPMYEYVVQNYRSDSLGARVPDPQDHCVINAIMRKHNFTGYSMDRETSRTPFLPMLKFKEVFGPIFGAGLDNWERGEYFLSEGVAMQGYHLTMFINKKLVQTEFDVWALFRPLTRNVWMLLLLTICMLCISLKIFNLKFQQLHILAVILEQDVHFTDSWKDRKVYMMLAVWMFASNQLRLAYTANMYSFLTAESPPKLEDDLKEVVTAERRNNYKIFVAHKESMQFFTTLALQVGRMGLENGREYNFYENLRKGVKHLYEDDISELLSNKSDLGGAHSIYTDNNDDYLLNDKFALISYTHASKRILEKFINAMIIHPRDQYGQPSIPFETVFVTSNKYIWKRGKLQRWLSPNLWGYTGTRTFFSDHFERDLAGLIMSGIHSRWGKLTSDFLKLDYLMKKMGLKYLPALKSVLATSKHIFHKNEPSVFKSVDIFSLRLIWGLYFICILLAGFMFLKEIVRFDIAGRSNYDRKEKCDVGTSTELESPMDNDECNTQR